MKKKKKSGKSKAKRILLSVIIIVVLSLVVVGYDFYKKVYDPNISTWVGKEKYIYIPTGTDFSRLMQLLNEEEVLRNSASFEWVAERMGYKNHVKPGRYLIRRNMNNKQLVTLLRSGEQSPVKVVIEHIRTPAQLAGAVGRQLEADSVSINKLLKDPDFMRSYGFTPETALAFFIPNTYEFYWNTSATGFFKRMAAEYKAFWTPARQEKAKQAELSQTEVTILASIVEQETRRNDEKPIIAGVYINRYRKGWKLEADPTLVYAAGDFAINRVLNVHKEIDSPYNTYMYAGLPPGPICLPAISSVEAVLNYRKHNYMFFCAREDFSGYHNFATTYNEHLANARKFQKELNRRNIRS
ncbi:MAG TPA: endolytic transglycosylase MltG [Bacteroidia bacterium]|nr:endolytic transglycosylase MltG [Bacteroidia bacterium]